MAHDRRLRVTEPPIDEDQPAFTSGLPPAIVVVEGRVDPVSAEVSPDRGRH